MNKLIYSIAFNKIAAAWKDIPADKHKGIRDRIEANKKKRKGAKVDTSHKVLYHGSPRKFDTLETRPHYLADDESVAFATPEEAQAIASLGRWTDEDFDQGYINDEPMYMKERRPGAFKDVYQGKSGYIYSVDGEPFEWEPQLMRQERISRKSPKTLKRRYVPDAYEELRKSNAKLILHDGTVL